MTATTLTMPCGCVVDQGETLWQCAEHCRVDADDRRYGWVGPYESWTFRGKVNWFIGGHPMLATVVLLAAVFGGAYLVCLAFGQA